MKKYTNVDEYITSFPKNVQEKLETIRRTIQKAAPKATEGISYGMPGYKLNGRPLVYFGGYKTHIGFYPTPNGIDEFKKDLHPYAAGKGTVQFLLDQPLPLPLIKKIVDFRVKENLKKKGGE